MRLKTNLVISVIFVALLGFVYFYEIKGGEQRMAEAERARQLLDFSDHEARRLTVVRGDTSLVVEKGDEGWRVAGPVSTGADRQAIERYLRNLRETEVEGEPLQDSAAVAAADGLLAGYGLEAPRLRVLLEVTGDSARAIDTLRFGDDTPTERFTYVQRAGANAEVLRVRAWRFDNLDKGLFDLRDRRLLAFEQSDVRGLRLERAVEPVELSRQEGEWQLVAPLERAADGAEVDGILSRLHSAEVEAVVFEAPTADELSTAGLQEGAAFLELTLWIGEDRAEKRLRVGHEQADGARYARDSSRPHVFTVDSTLVNKLLTPLADLRSKDVLNVTEDEVARIELLRDGQRQFAATRDSAGDWSLVDAADREARTWRFNSLVSDLDAMEAEHFVEDGVAAENLTAYGLDAPRLAVRVERTDGTAEELLVGAVSDGGQVYVLRAGVATVLSVDADAVDNLELTLDDVSSPIEEAAEAAESAGG